MSIISSFTKKKENKKNGKPNIRASQHMFVEVASYPAWCAMSTKPPSNMTLGGYLSDFYNFKVFNNWFKGQRVM